MSTLTSFLNRDVTRIRRDRLCSKEGRRGGDISLAVLLPPWHRRRVWRQGRNGDPKGSKHLRMCGLRIGHQIFVVGGQALEAEDEAKVLSRIGHQEASPCQGEVALGTALVVVTLIFVRGIVCRYFSHEDKNESRSPQLTPPLLLTWTMVLASPVLAPHPEAKSMPSKHPTSSSRSSDTMTLV